MTESGDVIISRPPGLDILPPRYGPLFDRAASLFAADARVRGMWVHGAMARGGADAASDLDLSLAVRDDDFAAVAAEWETRLAAITPTVSSEGLPLPGA